MTDNFLFFDFISNSRYFTSVSHSCDILLLSNMHMLPLFFHIPFLVASRVCMHKYFPSSLHSALYMGNAVYTALPIMMLPFASDANAALPNAVESVATAAETLVLNGMSIISMMMMNK